MREQIDEKNVKEYKDAIKDEGIDELRCECFQQDFLDVRRREYVSLTEDVDDVRIDGVEECKEDGETEHELTSKSVEHFYCDFFVFHRFYVNREEMVDESVKSVTR